MIFNLPMQFTFGISVCKYSLIMCVYSLEKTENMFAYKPRGHPDVITIHTQDVHLRKLKRCKICEIRRSSQSAITSQDGGVITNASLATECFETMPSSYTSQKVERTGHGGTRGCSLTSYKCKSETVYSNPPPPRITESIILRPKGWELPGLRLPLPRWHLHRCRS